MEFSERKRSRKSQSFKLVNEEDFEAEYFDSAETTDVNGEMKSVTMPEAWLGDEGMEIKRQITGMMRLLNDKAGRVYQRVGREGETLKQEPQDLELGWARPPAATANTAPSQEEPQHSSWSHDTAFRPQAPGQYGTRSKTLKMLNTAKTVVKINDVVPPAAGAAEASCCMCNCKSTLQAILQELRTMRKLMQTQKGAQEKQRAQSSISPARSPAPRKRPRKRRSVHKVAPLAAPSKRVPVPASPAPDPNGRRERPSRERLVPAQPNTTAQPAPPPPTEAQPAHYSLIKEPPSTEPEVQLAEDYDVYIPKSQLDSILVNYTRSGSLLFRKLVCAFFDDATLANSLPNGKRKRGLNDNRKGLDQNIVGAIKAFTEKYCTANRIERLPGPRDWVQILQDQIKLARRRLKRGNWAEAADCDDNFNRTSIKTEDFHCSEEGREGVLPTTGCGFEKTAENMDAGGEKDVTA
ncbi:BEN domain-containing protein 7 isoform X2 [Megalops cyprinoides]|uniref:BEN domain-containing protein 7 isoform X2 n=1 Tax=Megalops cyprinoides TaxID=118141 RepID=UPI0018641E03|nr:BEN domain-containing protein 7 isoform X2 [Megalops cyprinoides]